MAWKCPQCGTEYSIAPKHCPCEPLELDIEEGINYYLNGGATLRLIELDSAEYAKALTWLKAQGITNEANKRKDSLEDSPYSLDKQTYHIGIETAGMDEEEIALRESEYHALVKHLHKDGASPPKHKCQSTKGHLGCNDQ